MNAKMYQVFVYGTLRKGGYYHQDVIKDSELVGYAVADGQMAWVSFPRFPGVVFKKNSGASIFGEVYRVTGQTLDQMDILEGYNEEHPEDSMYVRRPVFVTLEDGKTVEVQTYEYARREFEPRYSIPHGDFLRALREVGNL